MGRVVRAVLRQLDPTWPYRAERAKFDRPSRDEPLGWGRAPSAAALVTVGWQFAAVAAILGSTYLLWDGDLAEPRGTWLLAAFGAAMLCFLLGSLASVPLFIETVKRREWTLLMLGMPVIVVLLRGLEYGFLRRPDSLPSVADRSGGHRAEPAA